MVTAKEDTRFVDFIAQINEFTEITIAPTDDKYEWHWRCKESESSFRTPELALLDAINFICRDYEGLLISTLAKEEDVDAKVYL